MMLQIARSINVPDVFGDGTTGGDPTNDHGADDRRRCNRGMVGGLPFDSLTVAAPLPIHLNRADVFCGHDRISPCACWSG
jgi:hypothetical protein